MNYLRANHTFSSNNTTSNDNTRIPKVQRGWHWSKAIPARTIKTTVHTYIAVARPKRERNAMKAPTFFLVAISKILIGDVTIINNIVQTRAKNDFNFNTNTVLKFFIIPQKEQSPIHGRRWNHRPQIWNVDCRINLMLARFLFEKMVRSFVHFQI